MPNCILIRNTHASSHLTVKKADPSKQLIYSSYFSNNSPKNNNQEK